MDLARQRLEDGADTSRVAEHPRGGDYKFLPGAQNYRRGAGKRPGSNLGALQIGKDSDGFVNARGCCAQHGDAFGVICVRAVPKIETRDVHARAQQPVDDSWRATGRPDGADYLGMAKSHLLSDREVGDDGQEHRNPFIEGCNGKALVVAVHAG